MAYDLFYRKQIPTAFSRGATSAAAAGIAGGLGVLAAVGLLLVPRAVRRSEISRYRREFAGDLSRTQEMPAISMAELSRMPREETW
jgi:hypothetical protein